MCQPELALLRSLEMITKYLRKTSVAAVLIAGVFSAMAVSGASAKSAAKASAPNAYLEITLDVAPSDRPAAGAIYTKYKKPFLTQIKGARSKQLLVRTEDVQVLHGFDNVENANAYLKSKLFNDDVVVELKPLLQSAPEVRIYFSN